ncbi:antiviral reverse transcriptase Drt3b [Shewanella sp. SM23]|uniref:antiviral reverse transcriptase Drt3b n=1 Tax=Shewanella sp. SM23 TaxID=2912794 RepID=UPI0021DB43A8|nr:antiviral reverse transcriptase Drt3b [Shewanella sp. SM23]MCU8083099.1 RNA-directed DNA polymerase [Shewanella sp. SM23]
MNKSNVDYLDENRVIATELTPFETPLVFSNEGFYKNVKSKIPSGFLNSILSLKKDGYTIPYSFKIDKDENSERRLALIHPGLQIDFVSFYDKYKFRMIESCDFSGCSLRRPIKLASKYYSSRYNKVESELKSDDVEHKDNQNENSFQNSFFAYDRYSHINLFTSSNEFIELEADFKYLLKLDIQSCFESIYTHSICWAVKDKLFSKKSVGVDNFENKFDKLMQRINFNETNGIIIGPEISRIFSEVILQKVEDDAISKLNNIGVVKGRDYVLLRYVDDYFIFSNRIEHLNEIEYLLADSLFFFKLSINESKRFLHERPFYTSKDIAIDKIRVSIKKLDHSISKLSTIGLIQIRVPFFGRNERVRLVSNTVREIKAIISEEKVKISDVTPYLQKTIKNIIFGMIDKVINHAVLINDDMFEYLATYFDLLLYFYSLDRRTTSSFSFCFTLIVLNDFFKERSQLHHLYFLDRGCHFLKSKIERTDIGVKSSSKIELYNLTMTLQYINVKFEGLLDLVDYNILRKVSDFSYFDFVCLMTLVVKSKILNFLIPEIVNECEARILFLISEYGYASSELIHLTLDYMACPSIDKTRKVEFLNKFFDNADFKAKVSQISFAIPKSNVDKNNCILDAINYSEANHWFTDWNNINIRKILLKKELNPTY